MSPRKLFAPTPIANTASARAESGTGGAASAAALAMSDSKRSYSLRPRSTKVNIAAGPSSHALASSSTPARQTRAFRSSTKRSAPAQSTSSASDLDDASASDFSNTDDGNTSASDDFTAKPNPQAKAAASTPKKRTKPESTTPTVRKRKSSSSPTKPAASPFAVSPRKSSSKPIKLNLEPHEAHPAPPHWQTVYSLLAQQRAKIVAPVDTMGCEENGREDRRADAGMRSPESPEEAAKRERLATLVSLMLSSQTKDPVTAEAVYNLQRTLPNGLCLQSLLQADDATISNCIAKVGFWRRKTGYLKSAARILAADFDGDVPRTVDELCSLPGVGPKMAFLALSSMGIQVGIGVDTHVHRLTNRLGWHKTKTPEETRLNLQSWLPTHLHAQINKLLVGFGQVICVPISPRCDLCSVGQNRLCPSYRPVDPKAALKRVKVHLVDSDKDQLDPPPAPDGTKLESDPDPGDAKVEVKLEFDGPEGKGSMQIADLTQLETVAVKKEHASNQDDMAVQKALDW